MKIQQLFLLPFAGGSSYSYQFLLPYLKNYDVVFLELPGRGKRIKEPLITDYHLAAQDICLQIKKSLNWSGFLIFGHSLGACLALTVASLLEQQGICPAHVIVSGNSGPGTKERKFLYLLDDVAFITEIKKLGGISDEICANEQLIKFYLPILKADFKIAEFGSLPTKVVIKAPIFAIMGSEEEYFHQIDNWSKFTTSGFESKMFKGGHFFIYDYPDELSQIIAKCGSKTINI